MGEYKAWITRDAYSGFEPVKQIVPYKTVQGALRFKDKSERAHRFYVETLFYKAE